MKIVSYLFADGYTGAARMGAEVTRVLQPDLKVAVFSPARGGGPLQDLAEAFGSQVVAAPAGVRLIGKAVSYGFGLAITAFHSLRLAAISREVVLVYGGTMFSLPLAALSLFPNVKTILHLHELGTGRGWLDRILLRLATFADAIVCVSRFHEQELKKLLPRGARKKLRVVENCVPDVVDSMLPFKRRDIPLIYVGGATRRKGIRVIAEVARRLEPCHSLRWQLCLSSAGQIDSESVDVLSRLQTVEIAWDARDVLSYLRRARVAVVPTVPELCSETFGLVLVEAAMCGCQVVASDSGAYQDTLTALRTGILVPGRSEQELAQALCETLPRLCREAVEPPPVNIVPFLPHRMAEQWKAIIAELTGNGVCPRA